MYEGNKANRLKSVKENPAIPALQTPQASIQLMQSEHMKEIGESFICNDH